MTRDQTFSGLSSKEVVRSREVHGANVYERAKRRSFFRRILDNLKDPIIRILLFAMAVNLIFTFRNINWAENVGMVIAIVVSTVVSALSERGSERAFEKLREQERRQKAEVIRDGRTVEIGAEELVVGDHIFLFSGQRVPADCRLLEGTLKVDESTLSGESKPVRKRAQSKNVKETLLYAGSMIAEGEGQATVTTVGDKSLYGQIAKEIQRESEESPLKKRLSKLASTISKIGYAAAAVVALAYLFNVFVIDSGYNRLEILVRLSNLRFVAMHLIKAVTIAMTVIVVAVPEGLPMMISVVLSANMKKMMRDRVLVRKPVGIETAGCINILFTDKTGTLTVGKPVCEEMIFCDGSAWDGKTAIEGELKDLIDLSIHTNSSVLETESGAVGGNGTDSALYGFIKKRASAGIIRKIPFDSTRKYSSATVNYKDRTITLIKGAPEKIVDRCVAGINKDGRKTPLEKNGIDRIIKKLSGEGKRLVALAVSEGEGRDEIPSQMVLLAIAVLNDALRPDAKKAVKSLKNAGIHTVMITGDARETAESIARESGITGEKGIVISGNELSEKTDLWVKEHLYELAVIYRALPNDKNRLVRLSREKGLIAGMTGDGVNDAPALKNADVGFAMGSGSDIAKEASDIIILDNDLKSIVNAVLYGRTIFKSIRKFITFQLIMNICAVGVTFFGQLMGVENPVTVIQMLWINMIMDTLGGLAFAGEYPMKQYLRERPIGRDEPILKKRTLTKVFIMGVYGTALCTWFLKSARVRTVLNYENEPEILLTAFFALFIFTGIAISFTARSERMNLLSGLTQNRSFAAIMSFITVVQLIMLYFGGKTFRCVGMNIRTLATVAVLALTVLPVDIAVRVIMKRVDKRRIR
ncbi:MAG: calcium-translocating P-type ATPase, PMCA-type [Clostridia bacterium]|nr:calcium-translocating P-type ATPase, PMCA-type [Clostridia bacterium]